MPVKCVRMRTLYILYLMLYILYRMYRICQRSYGMVVAVTIKAEAEVAQNSYSCWIVIVHVCIWENDQGCPVNLLECIKYCFLEGIQYPIALDLLFANILRYY